MANITMCGAHGLENNNTKCKGELIARDLGFKLVHLIRSFAQFRTEYDEKSRIQDEMILNLRGLLDVAVSGHKSSSIGETAHPPPHSSTPTQITLGYSQLHTQQLATHPSERQRANVDAIGFDDGMKDMDKSLTTGQGIVIQTGNQINQEGGRMMHEPQAALAVERSYTLSINEVIPQTSKGSVQLKKKIQHLVHRRRNTKKVGETSPFSRSTQSQATGIIVNSDSNLKLVKTRHRQESDRSDQTFQGAQSFYAPPVNYNPSYHSCGMIQHAPFSFDQAAVANCIPQPTDNTGHAVGSVSLMADPLNITEIQYNEHNVNRYPLLEFDEQNDQVMHLQRHNAVGRYECGCNMSFATYTDLWEHVQMNTSDADIL